METVFQGVVPDMAALSRWLPFGKKTIADCPSRGINADGIYVFEEGGFLNAGVILREVITYGSGDYG